MNIEKDLISWQFSIIIYGATATAAAPLLNLGCRKITGSAE